MDYKMNKQLLIGMCIVLLMFTSALAASKSYEVTAVSRLVGETPSDLEKQLKMSDINLNHATYKGLSNNNNKNILGSEFGSSLNEVDAFFDQGDYDQFENSELLFLDGVFHDTSQLNDAFNSKQPLFLYDLDYAGLAIPKQDSQIRGLTKDSAVISTTFKKSNEFMRSFICNLRDNERTLGETYLQARNNYYWNTKNPEETIGLNLLSYQLYGNPLLKLNSPSFSLTDIDSYCGDYSEEFTINEFNGYDTQSIQTVSKKITVNFGPHQVVSQGNYSIISLDGAIQNYEISSLVLPKRLNIHKLPYNTVITNINLTGLSNYVDLTVPDLPEWENRFIDRNCYQDSSKADISFSHTQTEDSELALVMINPLEVLNCTEGRFRIYKSVEYEIDYLPYSPVLLNKIDYPQIVGQGSEIQVNITLENLNAQVQTGILLIKDSNNVTVAQMNITTSTNKFNIKFNAPNEEGLKTYTIMFMQNNEIKTKSEFNINVLSLDSVLSVPKTTSSVATGTLSINSYFSSSINTKIKSSIVYNDLVVSSSSQNKTLTPGSNTMTLQFTGLDPSKKIYKAVVDIIYTFGIKTLTATILINNAPNLDSVSDISIFAGDKASVTLSGSDSDGDDLTYYLPDARFEKTDDYEFEWHPDDDDIGSHVIEYGVTDSYETSSKTFNVIVNPKPSCFSDNDCGEDSYLGSTTCAGSDINQVYREYTCQDPGTSQAKCTYEDTASVKDCPAQAQTTPTAGTGGVSITPSSPYYCTPGQCQSDYATCFIPGADPSKYIYKWYSNNNQISAGNQFAPTSMGQSFTCKIFIPPTRYTGVIQIGEATATSIGCGDNIKNGNEMCDSNSRTCSENGRTGTQSCNQQCTGWNSCVPTPVCGDNLVEGSEVCDNSSQSCNVNGYSGTQSCNSQCNGWNSCSTGLTCGDNIKNGNEICDGNDLSGQTCQTKGFSKGTLSCNAQCNGYLTTSCGDTPPIPTGLTVTSTTASSASLSWTASNGATSYKIYRSTSSGGTYSNVGNVGATSFVNSGLTSSTTYYYKVSAVNSFGESAQSSYVSTKTSGMTTVQENSNSVSPGYSYGSGGLCQRMADITLVYNKPANALPSSRWQIKYGASSSPIIANLSIPSSCWNYGPSLYLKIHFEDVVASDCGRPSMGKYIDFKCNGGTWTNILSISSSSAPLSCLYTPVSITDGNYGTYSIFGGFDTGPSTPYWCTSNSNAARVYEESMYWDT